MVRMQFDGSSRAEAIKECSRAVEKLKEYMPVTTQDDAPPPLNQPPTEVPAPVIQVAHFSSQYITFLYINVYTNLHWLYMFFLFQLYVQYFYESVSKSLSMVKYNLKKAYDNCYNLSFHVNHCSDNSIALVSLINSGHIILTRWCYLQYSVIQ